MKILKRFFHWLSEPVWIIRFWWFPPKGIRSFGISRVFYDCVTSYALYLFFVHISISDDAGYYDDIE